jgi:hypothetical protein
MYMETARPGNDHFIRIADQSAATGSATVVDDRTAAQKFEDLNESVRTDMHALELGIPGPGITSDIDVFKKYVDQYVSLIDEADSQFASHWKIYQHRYSQLKESLAPPIEQVSAIVDEARNLVAALPEDKREEVSGTLGEIGRFPDVDLRFWSKELPADGKWVSIRQRLEDAQDASDSMVSIDLYKQMHARILEEVQLMSDLRSYSSTFLTQSGRSPEAEQNERQMVLLQFTFDNFSTAKMLEEPTLKLRDYEQDGFPEVDFWKK